MLTASSLLSHRIAAVAVRQSGSYREGAAAYSVLHRRAQPMHPCLALLRLCTDHAHKRSNSKLHGRCFELFAQLTKVKARIADLEIRLSADAFAPYARRRARVVSQCVGACSWLRRAAATNCGVLSGGPCGLCRRRSPGWFVALVCFTCILDSQGLGGGALTKRSSAIGIRSIPRPSRPLPARRALLYSTRNVPPPFFIHVNSVRRTRGRANSA